MKSKVRIAAAGAVAATLLLGACGTGGGGDTGNAGAGNATGTSASLTIAKPDGAINVESNNPWVDGGSAMTLGYINFLLEPLGHVNMIDPSADVTPWLAETIEWNDDYTELTVTARPDVLWSDGEAFSAEDIAFTFELIRDTPAIDMGALGITDVTVDGDAVTIGFDSSKFVRQHNVLHTRIVPKHFMVDIEDPTTDRLIDIPGTGPYVKSQWSSQSVTLTARDDYWGGTPAVPTLFFVSYNDNTALATALANGEADWAQAFIPNVQTAFLDHDPEHNVFWAPAGLSIDAMFVNHTRAPFDSQAFRQAVNMVIDREAHATIAREGVVPALESVTGLAPGAGDGFIIPEFEGADFVVDVDGAKAILEEAGYTGVGEALVDPQGNPVTFTITVPQGWTDYVTGISLIGNSVQALGVDVALATPDADSWWDLRSNGDFDAILHWTDGASTPFELYGNSMGARWLAPVGESADFNFGRFQNPEADAALEAFAAGQSDDEREAALETLQRIFVDEVPIMPVGTRPTPASFNTRSFVGWPSAEDPFAAPDPTQPGAVKIIMALQPAA